jgi:hypothetical protein
MSYPGLSFCRSRRFSSRSTAERITSRRLSPSCREASRRAVIPFGKGRVSLSGNSIGRPTPRSVSYVRYSGKGHLFRMYAIDL